MAGREGLGISHPNIAFIKYWGKEASGENIPLNGSISQTLTELKTVTRVVCGEGGDMITYDGASFEKVDAKAEKVISIFRKMTGDSSPLKIITESNFPASCGLASSASGISALALALNDFYSASLPEEELSKISRAGSGSAARSIHKGIVHMQKDAARSVCHWPELRIFAVLVSGEKKKVGSTEGMQRTVATSSLFKQRQSSIGEKLEKMLLHVKGRDFEKFALLTMKDSNEMHACCMDSFPPVFYMNDRSREIVETVNNFNAGGIRLAYTFDAGPNAFIVTLQSTYSEAWGLFERKGFTLVAAL